MRCDDFNWHFGAKWWGAWWWGACLWVCPCTSTCNC